MSPPPHTRSKPKHSGKIRAEDEWYVEPAWCVELLRDAESFTSVYDPACGQGTIVKVFGENYGQSYGTDIVKRWDDSENSFSFSQRDFLTDKPAYLDSEIVCNPPYLRGEGTIAFIERALEIDYFKSAFLVNESFLFSQRRKPLFKKWPLKKIWFLSRRPSMPPGQLLKEGKIKAKGGTANYAWLIFEPGYEGNPECGWL